MRVSRPRLISLGHLQDFQSQRLTRFTLIVAINPQLPEALPWRASAIHYRRSVRQKRSGWMAQGIAAIGECMLELSGQAGIEWRMGYAGDTFNTLWAIRALSPGHHVDYVSAFGDDPFSEAQIAFFRDHEHRHRATARSSPVRSLGLYAITLTGAERSFTYWRSDAAARQLANDPAKLAKSLENRALIYFSGITLAILTTDARQDLAEGARRRSARRVATSPLIPTIVRACGRMRQQPAARSRRRWRSPISRCRPSPTNRNALWRRLTRSDGDRDWSAPASPKSSSRTATSRR